MKVHFRERMHEDKEEPQWDWVLDGDNGEPLSRSTESYNNPADAVRCFEMTNRSTVVPGALVASVTTDIEPVEVEWELLDS